MYAEVIAEYHCPPMMGHGGFKRTYELCKNNIYIPKLKAVV